MKQNNICLCEVKQ